LKGKREDGRGTVKGDGEVNGDDQRRRGGCGWGFCGFFLVREKVLVAGDRDVGAGSLGGAENGQVDGRRTRCWSRRTDQKGIAIGWSSRPS